MVTRVSQPYIDPRAKALRHLDRLHGWATGLKPAPVTVEWDLSNRCVLGCQDCHFAHTHVRGPWAQRPKGLPMAYTSTGDLADLELVRRVVQQLATAGVRGIVWSGGGEPTTHPSWLLALRAAGEAGLEQGIYTCGGLVTREAADEAARWLSWVVVSLDACDAETYAREKGVPPERFAAASEGVRLLAECGELTVGVSYLLHADNWRRAPAMAQYARSLGATYTTFRPAIRTRPDQPGVIEDDLTWVTDAADRSHEGLALLEGLARLTEVEIDVDRFRAYRDWKGHGYPTCYGTRLNTTITPDGRVWECPQRRGVPESCLGDLRAASFSTIWARHPGGRSDLRQCRAMCRLHPVNQVLSAAYEPRPHEAFV